MLRKVRHASGMFPGFGLGTITSGFCRSKSVGRCFCHMLCLNPKSYTLYSTDGLQRGALGLGGTSFRCTHAIGLLAHARAAQVDALEQLAAAVLLDGWSLRCHACTD